jgi:DNA polymerase delta subunit 1
MMYKRPDAPEGIDTKGIELVRRDSCVLVKEASTSILDAIMHDKDAIAALDAARGHVRALLAGEVGMDKLIVSKALRGEYKSEMPHARVAKNIEKRRGFKVPVGSRVPFVILYDARNPCAPQFERAEDPEYASANDAPLDRLHYLDLVMSATKTLLRVLVEDPEAEILGHPTIAPLLEVVRSEHENAVKVAKRVRKNVANNQLEITRFFTSA